MKKWAILVVCGLFFLLSGCARQYNVNMDALRQKNMALDMDLLTPQEPVVFAEPLTLQRVIELGLKNNLDMRLSEVLAQIADDEVVVEKLKMLPNLDADGRMQHRSNHEVTDYEHGVTGYQESNSYSDEKDSRTANLTLSWNILDFGLSYIRSRQAGMTEEIKQMEKVRQGQKLAMELAGAYYRVVFAEVDLKHIQEVKAQVAEYKDTLVAMATQGRIDPLTSRELEKRLVDMAITASKVRGEISGAYIELRRLMGLRPNTVFSLEGKGFAKVAADLPTFDSLDGASLERIALLNRPELFATDLQVKIQQDEARAALLRMFPSLHFDAGVSFDSNKFLHENSWNTVGAGVAYNLLSLPSKYMSMKAREKGVSKAELERLANTAGIIAQVHMALHDYVVKREQFKLFDESYGISTEMMNMTRTREEIGKVSKARLTRSMLESMVAKLERDRSLIDYLNAYNRFMVALGLDYEKWDDNLEEIAREGRVCVESETATGEDVAIVK